jgi:hypothetical protein
MGEAMMKVRIHPPTTTVASWSNWPDAVYSNSTVRSMRDPQRTPTPEEVLGHSPTRPFLLSALTAAAPVFPWLRQMLRSFAAASAVTRSGEVILTFSRGRRYAIVNADADGDLVLTLTDRATNKEADARVLDAGSIHTVPAVVAGFLGA